MTGVSWLTVQSRDHIECGVVVRRRLIGRSIGGFVVVFSWFMKILSDPRNGVNYSWWSTVKTAVFGTSSNLPSLVDRGGKLVWSADEKASLFSAHFDAKQCRDGFHSCDPFSSIVFCCLPVQLCS